MSNQNIQISKMQNGITLCSDFSTNFQTISIILGVKTGSRNETNANNGISHFLEHMAFKGTAKRSAQQIAQEIDFIGASINACTSKEYTLYYIKALKKDLELCIDILTDIYQNSIFQEEEIEKEKTVILQELAMTLDTPDDVVFDYFSESFFGKETPLGRTILGLKENIESFERKDFVDYVNNNYTVEKTFFGICGNVDHIEFENLCNKYIGDFKNTNETSIIKQEYAFNDMFKTNINLQQAQCVLGFKGPSVSDENYFTYQVLNIILGSGMSSRLFQSIRENLGLVYTVCSAISSYQDIGTLLIYAGTDPRSVQKTIDESINQIAKIKNNLAQDEMQKALNNYEASFIFSQESTFGRCRKMIKNLMNFDRIIDNQEIINNVKNVTKANIFDCVDNILSDFKNKEYSLVCYGNIDKKDLNIN